MTWARVRTSTKRECNAQPTQNRVAQRESKTVKYNKSKRVGKPTDTLQYNLNIIYNGIVVVTNLKSYLSCTNP